MHAAAEGHSTLGIPKKIGEEFDEADPGGKLPKKKKEAGVVKRIMRAFKMNEISAVDRPAQAHAKVVIMKRQEDSEMDLTMNKEDIQGAVDAAVVEIRKEFEAKLMESSEKLAAAEAELAKAKANPGDGKDGEPDGDDTKKFELPEEIQKALDEAKADKIILKQLVEEREIATYAKRAVSIGLEEPHGEIMRKAYTGDKDAIAKLEALMKGLAEQVTTGKIFAEFGSNRTGAGATAADDMNAAAAAYRETQIKIGKKCSIEQAFTHVYTDPGFAELKKRYDAEDMKKRHAA